MATTKGQRIGIAIILIVTVIGTLGGFAVMILTSQNQTVAKNQYQAAYATYEKEYTAYQAKVTAQSDELSAKYYPTFIQYTGTVAQFPINSVSSLATEDLLAGDGEAITGTTKFATYYLGWDANGNRFTGGSNLDTTKNKLNAPLAVESGLDSASLIDGWKEGMKGMRIGGVRLISIPSDKAYKEAGSKDSSGNVIIAPNMPLKFIVMAIPLPETIAKSQAYTDAESAYYKAYTDYYGNS